MKNSNNNNNHKKSTDNKKNITLSDSSNFNDSSNKSLSSSTPSSLDSTIIHHRKKPKESAFTQQTLPAWRPVLTPYNVIPILFIIGILFTPLGGLFLWTSLGVQEYVLDYTDCLSKAHLDKWSSSNSDPNQSSTSSLSFDWRLVSENICELRWNIPKSIKGPVMIYYKLSNYYQNQRMYVKSVDWRQLKGEALNRKELSNCAPLIGPDDDKNVVYYPCGLIANSLFSDTFGSLVKVSSSLPSSTSPSLSSSKDEKQMTFKFEPNGIAWSSDQKKYGPSNYKLDQIRPPPFWKSNSDLVDQTTGNYKEIPNFSNDERLQVWMRVAGLPTFRKPYGKYLGDSIPSGQYTILIKSIFDVESFGGRKAMVISNYSWLGGRNLFIGIAYIIVGTIFLLLGTIFLARQLWKPRKIGDVSYLSWNK